MSETTILPILGLTLSSVTVNRESDEIAFVTEDGRKFAMEHCQDCCERVVVEDICGELSDLLNSPITLAEETTEEGDCQTWTFYRIGTAKGMVTIRWNGESNGYYSERVDFWEVRK